MYVIYLKNYLTNQAARNSGCGPLPENINKIFVKYRITGHPYCLCAFYFGTYTEAVNRIYVCVEDVKAFMRGLLTNLYEISK
jgi:hypothetical protein